MVRILLSATAGYSFSTETLYLLTSGNSGGKLGHFGTVDRRDIAY